MKKLHLLFIIASIIPILSQGQIWSWETIMPNGNIADMKTMPSGNSYITGSFPNIQPKDSASTADYFLLKIDSSGNIVSGIKKAPLLLQTGLHVGTDHDGNIYVVGTPFIPQANNYYLQKYNAEGLLIWGVRFFIEGNVSALDVNYGRIALTGTYKKVLSVYGPDGVSVNKTLGRICDPNYEYPCSFMNDIFIANFNVDGALVWAEKYYTQMRSAYVQDENYYFTKTDYDDAGLDVAIDKDQNTIFAGVFSYSGDEYGEYMVLGNLKLDFDFNNSLYPTMIAKFDAYGEPQWASLDKKGIYYKDSNKRVATDDKGYIYNLYEYMQDSVYINIVKRKPNGKIEWERKIKYDYPEHLHLDKWTWLLDSLGNSFLQVRFHTENIQYNIFNIISDNNVLIKDFGNDENFFTSSLGLDTDNNIYFSNENTIKKYITRMPHHFMFTGNGFWKSASNWENQIVPPEVLPKWDTITIQTLSNDSCVLDTVQYMEKASMLFIDSGSKLIIPNSIEIGNPPLVPAPISAFAEIAPSQVINGQKIGISCLVQTGNNPISTGLQVIANLSSLGGSATQPLFDNGTDGDVIAGDLSFNFLFTTPIDSTSQIYFVPISIADAEGRTYTDTVNVTLLPAVGGNVVISQIYAGGGITGSTYKNDFVELFNRSNVPVNVNGWSLQYASAIGTDLFGHIAPTPLIGTLQPGQYYLITLHKGNPGVNLPLTADASDTVDIPHSNGKLVLVNTTQPLGCNGSSSPCTTEQKAKIVDLVGYGTANYFEKNSAVAIVNGNKFSLQRYWSGCLDNDDNGNDLYLAGVVPRNSNSITNNCQSKVVISQISGAPSAPYRNQFIELFNKGSQSQDLTGWSVQYADSTSINWKVINLTGTIQPGKYYLIKLGFLPGEYKDYLPRPEATSNILLNHRSGKVALSTKNAPLDSCMVNGLMDFVGYGGADCFEGTGPAVAGTNLFATIRKESGCIDNNQNQQDFLNGSPIPHNSESLLSTCDGYLNDNSVVDPRDGKVYPIKRYGTQVWMTMNMDFRINSPYYRNVYYNNDSTNGLDYGRLYDWDAAMRACPSGWHLPSRTEWTTLIGNAGGGGAMKDTAYWEAPNTGASNISKFNARPGGKEDYYFEDKGYFGYWWTSTYHTSTGVIHWADVYSLSWNSIQVSRWEYDISGLYSVRCVKN